MLSAGLLETHVGIATVFGKTDKVCAFAFVLRRCGPKACGVLGSLCGKREAVEPMIWMPVCQELKLAGIDCY